MITPEFPCKKSAFTPSNQRGNSDLLWRPWHFCGLSFAVLFSCSVKHSVVMAQKKLNNEFPLPRGKPSVGWWGHLLLGQGTSTTTSMWDLQPFPFTKTALFPLTLGELLISDLWHQWELRAGLWDAVLHFSLYWCSSKKNGAGQNFAAAHSSRWNRGSMWMEGINSRASKI